MTEKGKNALNRPVARSRGPQVEFNREAIDTHLTDVPRADKSATLVAAAGLWRNRTDLPDFATLRASWDRVALQ